MFPLFQAGSRRSHTSQPFALIAKLFFFFIMVQVQIKLFFAFILAAAAAIAPAVALPVPVENLVLPTNRKPAVLTGSMEPPARPSPPLKLDPHELRESHHMIGAFQ